MGKKSYFNIAGLLVLLVSGSVSVSNAGGDDKEAGRVTVSGISSGGHAAVQMHVALSGTISGAGVIAGGPYHCAEGNLLQALGPCISGEGLDVGPLVEATRAAAIAGKIDQVESLSDDRVWLFHGKADSIVKSAVVEALRDFYAAFLPEPAITLVDNIPVTHGWPTVDKGIACGEMGADYINACDYDAAGFMLQYLYGPLSPPVPAVEASLKELDQASIAVDGASFADTGYAYVPETCAQRTGECRLHVAFHGCRQGKEFIEDRFARMSGLNEWAESNDIIVLYPQVTKSLSNPQGCWDWWGYTGADYDQQSGKQVTGIAALIKNWSE